MKKLANQILAASLALTGLGVVLSSCSTPPPPVALHNLERPTDMAFACVGVMPGATAGGAMPVVSGRPMPECHAPGRFDAFADPTRRTFGLVTNTARGEISVIDMDASKLVDLDPANPDTNVAPLGVLPEQISASDDGCRVVSANRGSCDLTMVDVGALVRPGLLRQERVDASGPQPPPAAFSQTVTVTTASGRLHVAPQEILFLPQDTSLLAGQLVACGDRPTAPPIAWSDAYQGSNGDGWKAVVTFPTCNLVALVDLPTGQVVDSVQMVASSNGTSIDLVNTGTDPHCAKVDFCDGRDGPDAGTTGGPDAGADGGSDAATDGGADASSSGGAGAFANDPFINPTGVRPGPLVIRPAGDRLYVGLGQAAFVIALDVKGGHLVVPPYAQIPLHEGARGVDRVRLSVDPYKATGVPGQYGGFVGEGPLRDRQFLYAIARDGSLRIVDVSRSARLQPEIECDANIDPAKDNDPSVACRPADPRSDNRRPFTNGPGLRLPTIPRDVAAVDLTTTDVRAGWENVLDGAYAFVLTSSGTIYEVNIAPTLRTKTLAGVNSGTTAIDAPLPEEPPLVSSLRDRNIVTYVSNQDPSVGPPRLDLPPTIPAAGPQILAISSTSARDNPLATKCGAGGQNCEPVATYVFFPKRSSVQRQTWDVNWEGDYLGPSFSGQFYPFGSKTSPPRGVPLPDPGTIKLIDTGVRYCSAGVLPGDFVTLFGCTQDAQCGPGQVCKRSDTAPETVGAVPINGLCMPVDPTEQARRVTACQPLLDSVRRYEIIGASESVLTLRPRIDEITSETLDTCATAKEKDRCSPATDPTRGPFTCETLSQSDAALHCVQVCDEKIPCRTGRTCVRFNDYKSLCADAPPIDGSVDYSDQGCPLDQLTAYKAGAGRAFLMQGTAPSVYIPGIEVGGTCQADRQRLDRIPVFTTTGAVHARLPLCPVMGDPPTSDIDLDSVTPKPADLDAYVNGLLLQRLQASNPTTITAPCLVRTSQTKMTSDGKSQVVHAYYALFQNRELRFALAHLETYLGDSQQILFDVHGGFQAETVLVPGNIAMDAPARLLLSPIDAQGQASDLANTHELPFLFVVDQRRLARASLGLGATRGQVLRVYSRKATGSDVNSLLPVYDDFTSSGNLWPIQ